MKRCLQQPLPILIKNKRKIKHWGRVNYFKWITSNLISWLQKATKYRNGYSQIFYILQKMFQTTPQFNESPKKQYYSLQLVGSEKVISLSSSQDLGPALVVQNRYADDLQSFLILPSDEDFHILCKSNGLYLTVENEFEGSRIYCAAKSYQPNQKFRIQQTQKGSKQYYIYTFCGKVLEAAQHCKQSCEKLVIQKEFDGNALQKWSLHDFENLKMEP